MKFSVYLFFHRILLSVLFATVIGCTKTGGEGSIDDSSSNPGGTGPSLPGVAPSSPTLSQSITQASRVDLSWTASTGMGPITYTVMRSTNSGSGYEDVTGCVGLSTTTCNDTTVTAGTTYYYVVSAANAGGSASSSEVSAVPMAAFSITSVSVNNTANALQVSWSTPAGASAFDVKYKVGAGSYTTAGTGVSSPYTITGLTAGTSYDVMVTARNSVGTGGSIDANVVASGIPLAAFTISSFTTTAATTGSLVWGSSAGATSYTVLYGTTTGSYGSTVTTSGSSPQGITGLISGAPYYFMVTAVNSTGSLNATAELSAVQETAPSSPTLSRSITQASRVDLSWTASTGMGPITYTVMRSTNSGSGYADVAGCVGLSTTTCNDTTVTAGTTYYYVVSAANAGGSASSSEVSAVPMAAFSISLTPGKGRVSVSFASTGATSYNLQYGTSTGVYTTTINGATSPTVVSGLNFGTMYFFMVTAINASGALIASAEGSGSPSESWLSDYLYRQKIIINNTGVTQSTTGVPILVELPSTFNYAGTHADQSGKDIRFTSSDKQTPIPYFFEKWVYGSRSQIWVRAANVPAAGDAAEIFIYYGKSNAVDGQTETDVWSQSTGIRLNADDSSTLPNVLESVSGTFGTATAGVTSVSGILKQALGFDGLTYNVTTHPYNTEISIGRGTSLAQTSISLWIKPETGSAHGFRRIVNSDYAAFGLTNTNVVNMLFSDTTPTTIADLRGRIATDRTSDGGSSGPWQFIATTWDQTDLDTVLDGGAKTFETRSYFNGSLDMAWLNQLSSSIGTTVTNWVIGNRPEGTRPYKGGLDKLLIRESLDSADFLGIHYASVRGFEARLGVSQVSNSTPYSVTVNGTTFTFTSDATATTAEILSGLATQINAGAEPVSAGQTGSYLWINPDNPSMTFSLSLSDRLSRVVRSSFEKDVRVSVGSVANVTTYTVAINGSNFNYVSDADATAAEIRAGLLAAINGSTFPVATAISDSNLEFSIVKTPILNLSTSANLSTVVDGADRLLTITAVQNSTLYRVTVGGINADYTSDSTATLLEIRNGLIQVINSSSDANGASAAIEASQVRVKAATPREFSIATSTNLGLSSTISSFLTFGSTENW